MKANMELKRVLLLLALILIPSASSDIIIQNPTTDLISISNINITFVDNFGLNSNLTIGSNYLSFNGSQIQLTSSGQSNLTINAYSTVLDAYNFTVSGSPVDMTQKVQQNSYDYRGTYLYGTLIFTSNSSGWIDQQGMIPSTYVYSGAPAVGAGQFNITVLDEQNHTLVTTFTAQLYNSTTMIEKAATNGWANFSGNEVTASKYLIRIIPNSSYATRSVLATATADPTVVTVYIPSTGSNTIDLVAFYLLDYTGKFPFRTSYLVISKGSLVMHSSYFDSDAKIPVYLIRGESYTITVYNGDNMQQWGNYKSVGSGNVEIVLIDLGVDPDDYAPFIYNITWSSSNITLRWYDNGNVLNNLNYSIFKGNSRTLVHQLITSLRFGTSEYIVTNTSDIYYVYFTANTTEGIKQYSQIIDYRAGGARPDDGRAYSTWSYGTFEVPVWVKSAFALIALMMLAGSFGALHRGEGGIITSIMAVLFWYWDWLDVSTALAGFLGGLLLFAVLYHLESKRRQPFP